MFFSSFRFFDRFPNRRARLLLTSRVTVTFEIQVMHVVECMLAIIAELIRPAPCILDPCHSCSAAQGGAQLQRAASAVRMAPPTETCAADGLQ